jgi:hypothetical protein
MAAFKLQVAIKFITLAEGKLTKTMKREILNPCMLVRGLSILGLRCGSTYCSAHSAGRAFFLATSLI